MTGPLRSQPDHRAEGDEVPPRQLYGDIPTPTESRAQLVARLRAERCRHEDKLRALTRHAAHFQEVTRREEQQRQRDHHKYLQARDPIEAAADELWRLLGCGGPDAKQQWKVAPSEVRAAVMRRAAGHKFKQPRHRTRKG